jgi:hypothetical protein
MLLKKVPYDLNYEYMNVAIDQTLISVYQLFSSQELMQGELMQ